MSTGVWEGEISEQTFIKPWQRGAPLSVPVSCFRFGQKAAHIGNVKHLHHSSPTHACTHAHTQTFLIVWFCRLWSRRMLCFVAPLWSPSSFAFDNTDNPPTRSLIQSPTYPQTHTHVQARTHTRTQNISRCSEAHTQHLKHANTHVHTYSRCQPLPWQLQSVRTPFPLLQQRYDSPCTDFFSLLFLPLFLSLFLICFLIFQLAFPPWCSLFVPR